MSNYYKQQSGLATEHKNVRVINSNRLVEEKLEQLMREYQMNLKQHTEGGFVAGLNAAELPVEEIEEEPEPEISLEEIQQQAEQMIAEATQQAEQILNDARQQAEALKQSAIEQGTQEGRTIGQQQAEEVLKEEMQKLNLQDEKRQQDYEQELNNLEPKLLSVIVSVVEKVFHVQFDDKKEIMLYLISNTIANIEGSKEFQIRVSKDSYDFLNEHRDEILGYVGEAANIEFSVDMSMQANDCVIETDAGMFDCSMGLQLENLIKDIKSLCL